MSVGDEWWAYSGEGVSIVEGLGVKAMKGFGPFGTSWETCESKRYGGSRGWGQDLRQILQMPSESVVLTLSRLFFFLICYF